MKKLLIALVALSAINVYAATSLTTHYNLSKPADGDANWGDGYRANLDSIDTQMFINSSGLFDHISDPLDAHAATAISSTTGSIVCLIQTNVQSYLDCLDAQLGAITGGTVVATNTTQTITGLKTFATTPILSALSTGLVHSGVGGVLTSSLLVNADVDATAGITYGKLSLTDSIVNADVNSAAGIVYSKLSLTDSIVNADVNSSAAIAYSKLSLADSIVNADINSVAAIAYSKLNLSSSIVNADIATGAAIARSKLASGTARSIAVNDASGVLSSVGPLTNGQLLIGSTGAAPSVASLTGTANQVTVTPGAGSITLSTPQSIATTSAVKFGTGIFGVGIKDDSAILEAISTTQGFLPPRMTTTQRNAISFPANGLVIFNTTTNQLNVYNGSWGAIGGAASVGNFTTTTIFASTAPVQVWRYTGSSAQELSVISQATVLLDGTTIEITGTSNTNTITLSDNNTSGGWILNGAWVGTQHSKLTLRWDTTFDLFVEVSRNGL